MRTVRRVHGGAWRALSWFKTNNSPIPHHQVAVERDNQGKCRVPQFSPTGSHTLVQCQSLLLLPPHPPPFKNWSRPSYMNLYRHCLFCVTRSFAGIIEVPDRLLCGRPFHPDLMERKIGKKIYRMIHFWTGWSSFFQTICKNCHTGLSSLQQAG